MKKTILYLTSIFLAISAFAQDGEKVTLGITKIEATPSLITKMTQDGRKQTLDRVKESMDANLTSAIQATRKFELVSRSDMDAISKEIEFGESGNVAIDKNTAQSGKLKGAKYILVVSIDDFQDYIEKAQFASLGKTAEKRVLRFGAVAKLIDSSTGSIKEATNFTISNTDISDQSMSISASGNLNDSLIGEIARLMSNKIAVRVADTVFPIKIMAKTGSAVTLNRGDGAGLNIGDEYEIFALGEALIDPDTGEDLGSEEICVGKMKITRINPKISQGTVTEDNGVAKGQIVRAMPKAEEE